MAIDTPKQGRARHIFASNLRAIRKEKGLSQEALADLANLHRTYVGSVERGERNISIDNMEALSQALGTPLAGMFSEFPDEQAPSRHRQGHRD